MGCIPGEANSSRTKAGRQKEEQARDHEIWCGQSGPGLVGMARNKVRKVGLGQAALKVGLQSSDIKISQYQHGIEGFRQGNDITNLI